MTMHSFVSFKTVVGETHWRLLSEKMFFRKEKSIGDTNGSLPWCHRAFRTPKKTLFEKGTSERVPFYRGEVQFCNCIIRVKMPCIRTQQQGSIRGPPRGLGPSDMGTTLACRKAGSSHITIGTSQSYRPSIRPPIEPQHVVFPRFWH